MIQDKLVEELDISVRALNNLKQARVKTIGELLELTIERCKELGFSSRTIIEIETVKDSFGIQINPLLHQYNNVTEITASAKSMSMITRCKKERCMCSAFPSTHPYKEICKTPLLKKQLVYNYIQDLVKSIPNDMELGRVVRELFS
jgi:hypothetical protein